MARKRKRNIRGPWWRAAEGRWYATIGSKKVRFPKDIGEDDPGKAWARYDQLIAAGTRQKTEATDPTARAVVELYLAHLEAEATGRHISRDHYRNRQSHLGHFLAFRNVADRKVRLLTPDDLTRFRTEMGRQHSERYAANCANAAKACLNWAARPGSRADGDRLLDKSPFEGVKLPPVGRSPERFAERPAAAAWLAFLRRRSNGIGIQHRNTRGGLPGRWGTFRDLPNGRMTRNFALLQRVLIRTGARPGELGQAEWSEIVWDAGRTPAGHVRGKIVLPWWKWKNGKKTREERTIYLSAILTRALRREFERPGRHPTHPFSGREGPWRNGTGLAARVRQLRPLAVADAKERAEARGLPAPLEEKGPGRLVNYLWRHTAASTMLAMGIDMPRIAKSLGTSVRMIESVYGHLKDEHVSQAADALATGKLPRRPGT
jgi:integrase